MKNELDDLLNSVFGKSRTLGPQNFHTDTTPTLTLSGAELAKETVKSAAKKQAPIAAAAAKTPAHKNDDAPTMSMDTLQKAVPEMSRALDARIAQQRQEIDALNRTALADIERIGREVKSPSVQNLAVQTQNTEDGNPPFCGVGIEGFAGLLETLQKTVFGQDVYLQKLVIALKRPYIMGHIGEGARNSILLTGLACTGKHLSLSTAAAALKTAGVLATDAIAWVDLALYPTPAEEKLFLQDLYMALAGDAEIVAFSHYESCHSGFLTALANLVQRGKSPLANRYVLQNGRLVDAGTALVSDAVSALTPRGKYLVFVTTRPLEKLADVFGAPFVSALGDVCETAALSSAALCKIATAEYTKMAQNAQKTLGFTLKSDDDVNALAVAACGADQSAAGILQFWKDCYKALAQYKLEHEACAAKTVSLHAKSGRIYADFGEESVDLFLLLPQNYTGALAEVKAEMDEIVGLTEIKAYILSLENNYKIQARRKAEGLKNAPVSMHMIFTGNPGTGKTTIARLVSKYLKAIGVLSGGQLVEVTRADLVGKYVGHTAPLTTQVLKSAIGGVLFIDEAYSLYRGQDDAFGLECIDTLVKGMEDNRDNLLVILAGYSKEMAVFLTANSGLKSRFPNIIEFPDYTGAELLAILKLQAKGKGYALDASCDAVLLPYFNAVQLARARDAGNGRLARNKLEEAILNQSKRLMTQEKADLSLLLPEDFKLDDVNG
ncbi:MAG: AAA family ATPase [Ruthenibacterium sp.]